MSLDEKNSGFVSHLTELRKRLIHSFIFLIVLFVACYFYAEHLYGFLVDPFAQAGEVSLWRGGTPMPDEQDETAAVHPSDYDETKVDAIIASCKTLSVRVALAGIPNLAQRAAHTLIAKNYYPTRFTLHQSPYVQHFERKEVFQVPFQKRDFDAVVFLDEIEG